MVYVKIRTSKICWLVLIATNTILLFPRSYSAPALVHIEGNDFLKDRLPIPGSATVNGWGTEQ